MVQIQKRVVVSLLNNVIWGVVRMYSEVSRVEVGGEREREKEGEGGRGDGSDASREPNEAYARKGVSGTRRNDTPQDEWEGFERRD